MLEHPRDRARVLAQRGEIDVPFHSAQCKLSLRRIAHTLMSRGGRRRGAVAQIEGCIYKGIITDASHSITL